ncbi:MAG: hypothetical protein PUD59_00160 [bacterium]|nr:hypothetical protein [bacterium]
MSKKLPSIYKENSFKHKNNRTVYYTSNENRIFDTNGVFQNTNIDSVSMDKEYILNSPVIVETFDEIINTKIISKVGDHILTSNNKIIKLRDIKSIRKS